MSVKVRLKKPGKTAKKRHRFRIVVTDDANPRDGRFIEQIGYYDPNKNPSEFKINKERYAYWVSRGAIPSSTINSLVKKLK